MLKSDPAPAGDVTTTDVAEIQAVQPHCVFPILTKGGMFMAPIEAPTETPLIVIDIPPLLGAVS
jgi:hypothetical protein